MRDVSPSDMRPPTTESRPTARRVRRLTREARLDWMIGGVVLAVSAVVQVAFLRGPRPLDSAYYFDAAVDFPDIPVDLWTLRIGLVAPIRVAVLLFGPSEVALYAVPIATGLLLAAAVYGSMLLLFRDRVLAAAAALVTVLNTQYLLNSSWNYPDTAATATFTAGFFFLLLGGIRQERRPEGWVPTVAVVCAGVLFGWTYLIREFSPILLPAVLAAVVLLRYPLRRVGVLLGAALATFGLELLYGFLLYRQPFVHIDLLLNREDVQFSSARLLRMERIQGQLDTILDTLVVFPRLVLSWRAGWLFLLLLLIFVVALARFRDRRLWLLATWCFSFWGIMAVLGLWSLDSGRWIVNITNVRYWYPILPALVMGAFGGLGLLLEKRSSALHGIWLTHSTAGVLAVLVLAPGLVEYGRCAAADAWRNDPAERWDGLRSWFASAEADRYSVVWTDDKTQRLVPAYTRTTFGKRLWHGEVKTFTTPRRQIAPTSDLRDSVLLVHKDRFRSEIRDPQRKLDELRGEWSPVFISDDERMVVLAHASRTTSEPVDGEQAWWSLASDRAPAAAPGHCGISPYELRGQS